MNPAPSLGVAVGLLLAALMAPGLRAQCATRWLPGDGVPGVTGTVHALTHWDPDGAGPAPRVVVVGGAFTLAGSAIANNIAVYDPATRSWSNLGDGMNGSVRALTTLPNGDLVAGGIFYTAGGVAANCIARWDGTSWSPLGTGMAMTSNGPSVLALTALPNGDLVAGGMFSTAGGVVAHQIARWDGTVWTPLGTGMDGSVGALTTLSNGDLVAGGVFTTAGGVAASRIARWDGTAWSPLGTGLSGTSYPGVHAVTTLPNGDLVAGGQFSTAGGTAAAHIARWDGMSWWPLGTGMDRIVLTLATLPNGDLVGGGSFATAGGVAASRIARWDSTAWYPIGSGTGPYSSEHVSALTTLPTGDLVAGGSFTTTGGAAAYSIARWDGTAWSSLGNGFDGPVTALTTSPTGDLVAGGGFTRAGGAAANYIARWDGTAWRPLGTGIGGGAYLGVHAIATLSNGDLVAGGQFSMAGGAAAANVARWDGASWSALGTGLNRSVLSLASLPNGDLVAGGVFTSAGGVVMNRIARWDGTAWSPLGTGMDGGSDPGVYAVTTLPNGDLVAGGQFSMAGGTVAANVARWDGTSWWPLGTGVDRFVHTLLTLPNGDLVAGGAFTTAGGVAAHRIARWDGSSWSPLGAGMNGHVIALTTLPNDDLLAGGYFTTAGGVIASHVARWNGTAWSPLDAGLGSPGAGLSSRVRALTTLASGDLVAGGEFTTAGGQVSAYLARMTTTCPATAVALGTGCTGPGGTMALTATSLPWIGTTYRYRCTGMTANSVGFGVFGLAAQYTPLSALHPAGATGCVLLVTTDAVTMLAPLAGAVTHQFRVPTNSALVGATMGQQVLQFALGPAGDLTWLGSSNPIVLTGGEF